MSGESKAIWTWVGCGCFALAGLGLAAVGAATWFGVKTVQTMSDPEARQESALKSLQARTIPEGYEIELVVGVPFYADMVFLESESSDFIFLQDMRTSADLKAAIADEDRFWPELQIAGLEVGRDSEILAQDELILGSAQIRYMLVDGMIRFDLDKAQGERSVIDFDVSELGESDRGVGSTEAGAVFLIRCDDTDDPAFGLWTQRTDGTPIDADSLGRFLAEFGFCET